MPSQTHGKLIITVYLTTLVKKVENEGRKIRSAEFLGDRVSLI